ncbi:hypothetical protein cyc_05532 [Cyclospora cayetanensis]|uniref:Methyltransferase domain-containing protein n=1 Tax=Cyclospora cayetanensis TaxID=88456 RepID=A0A1D3D3B8_9EIME|nr:hypothetical protein cyc_05532 [Cyclospora cayetanensis]
MRFSTGLHAAYATSAFLIRGHPIGPGWLSSSAPRLGGGKATPSAREAAFRQAAAAAATTAAPPKGSRLPAGHGTNSSAVAPFACLFTNAAARGRPPAALAFGKPILASLLLLPSQEKLPSAGAAAATLNIPTAPSLATPAADESKRFYIRLHSSSGRCKSGGFCGSACSGTPTCALARRVHHQEELTGLNTCTQLGANTSTAASKATSTAASKAESKAASTTASKAESKGASTTASTAVSNALSKATSKAVSTTASKAALRAASTAVSRTASTTALKAASQAVSTTASKVALKAASKAVSRTASTTASLKAASKAVSTTAPEAASSKAALKALSTTASKAASGTSPPLAASEHSDDPTAVAAAAAEEQKLLAASAAADATRGSPRQLIAAEVPHAHHKAWCSSLSYAEKLKHLLDGRSVRRSLLQKEPPSTASICGQFAIPNHFAMLEDADRVSFYKEAILREGFSPEQSESQSEKKQQSDSLSGLHVLEVGCGPLALLSLLAVQQGAARVDALELNPGVYQFASTFVQQIGSEKPTGSAQLPEEQCYDLVLHEILGDFASQEGVADVIRDIQERSASIPRSIPFAARTFIGISELPSPCCIKYPVRSRIRVHACRVLAL